MPSVLRDWVMELPLREQGTLLTAVRGCDLTPKFPLDSLERRLVAAIRYSFLNPADEREVDREPGTFMSRRIPDARSFKPSTLGHYPQHWVAHVMHAVEVLGYRHPQINVRSEWHELYLVFCRSFHVPPESFDQFKLRMTEDRIAAGTVVG